MKIKRAPHSKNFFQLNMNIITGSRLSESCLCGDAQCLPLGSEQRQENLTNDAKPSLPTTFPPLS